MAYVGGDNAHPTAKINIDSLSGSPDTLVRFDGSGSFDPDIKVFDYSWDSWDFGDGSVSSLQTSTKQYLATGTFIVLLTVTDPQGKSDDDVVSIMVGPGAPTAKIVSPADGHTFPVGNEFTLIGAAYDLNSIRLDDSRLTWQV